MEPTPSTSLQPTPITSSDTVEDRKPSSGGEYAAITEQQEKNSGGAKSIAIREKPGITSESAGSDYRQVNGVVENHAVVERDLVREEVNIVPVEKPTEEVIVLREEAKKLRIYLAQLPLTTPANPQYRIFVEVTPASHTGVKCSLPSCHECILPNTYRIAIPTNSSTSR